MFTVNKSKIVYDKSIPIPYSFIFTGNVASYFQYRFVAQENAKPDQHWHYNFHKVTLSATIVFLYATLVPSGLFGALWSSTPKDSPIKPSLIELVCIFGYSLAPFVPASLLWLIQCFWDARLPNNNTKEVAVVPVPTICNIPKDSERNIPCTLGR